MANNNPNQDNLIQNQERSPNEARKEDKKNGEAGGIKSGEARRKQKSYKNLLDTLQNKTINKDQTISIYEDDDEGNPVMTKVKLTDFVKKKFPDIPENEINNALFAVIRLIELLEHPKAEVVMKAFEIIRDTSGQKPTDKLKIENEHLDLRHSEIYSESEIKNMDYEEIKFLIEKKHLVRYTVVSDKGIEEAKKRLEKEF